MSTGPSGLRCTVLITAGSSGCFPPGAATAAGIMARAAFTPHSATAGCLSFMNLIATSASRRLFTFSATRAVAMAALSRTRMSGWSVNGISALAAAWE